MKNTFWLAKSVIAMAVLSAGLVSEAQAQSVTIRVTDIVIGSLTNFVDWGKAGVFFLDENKDLVPNLGDLYVYTKPVTGDNIDGWVGNEVFNADNNRIGMFDKDIDWLSYTGSEYDGTLTTSLGTTYSASNVGIWLNPDSLTYTYDNGLSSVPVPAAAYLFASGLPLLAGAARRKNKAKA